MLLVSSWRDLRNRLGHSLCRHHRVVCSCRSPTEGRRGAPRISRGEDNSVVGYCWAVSSDGPSLCTCCCGALYGVERGEPKDHAVGDRVCGSVHCSRPGDHMDKLRCAHCAQRQLRKSRNRSSTSGYYYVCGLPVI